MSEYDVSSVHVCECPYWWLFTHRVYPIVHARVDESQMHDTINYQFATLKRSYPEYKCKLKSLQIIEVEQKKD